MWKASRRSRTRSAMHCGSWSSSSWRSPRPPRSAPCSPAEGRPWPTSSPSRRWPSASRRSSSCSCSRNVASAIRRANQPLIAQGRRGLYVLALLLVLVLVLVLVRLRLAFVRRLEVGLIRLCIEGRIGIVDLTRSVVVGRQAGGLLGLFDGVSLVHAETSCLR